MDVASSLRERARLGDAAAMGELGAGLLIGDDAQPDEAVAWLTKAAGLGQPDALALMATLAGAGFLMPQSWPASLDYLRRAAAAGSAEARAQLKILAGAEPSADDSDGDVWARLRERIDIGAWLEAPPRRNVCETPRVRMVDAFAPPAVCDWLRHRAEGRMRPAMMYDGATKTEQVDPHRTCSDFQFDVLTTDVVLLLVRARVAALTKLPTVAMEPPRIFHYALGEQIKPHYDRCNDAVSGYGQQGGYLGDRIVTFLLYLNDGFEGGDLDFPKAGFRCRGGKGDAVYFAHVDPSGKPEPLSLHAGLVITAGEKWVLSQWIHDRPFGVVEQPTGDRRLKR